MANTNVRIGDINSSQVAVGSHISQIEKTGAASPEPEQARLLLELTEQVKALAASLDESESVELLRRDLETLRGELAATKPRQAAWSTALDGIADTARSIGKAAAPVAATVAALMKVLAG